MANNDGGKRKILHAIRQAGAELGRAPSRGELKRITGMSHYRVLAAFRTLREAVRAAGLEPNPKGERIETEDLIKDWKRVKKKLGRRPSRAEYVREGRYSAGSFVARFGAWSGILTAKGAKGAKENGEEIARNTKIAKESKLKNGNREVDEETQREFANASEQRRFDGDKALTFRWAASLAAIPGPLQGKRRVTEAVAAMVVNTLMGAESGDPRQAGTGLVIGRLGDWKALPPSFLRMEGLANGKLRKDRPVMGPPFSRHPLTNAPVNEMGVVFLFALVAWDLGFQVESLWGRGYPDGRAKREVAPGKWQDVRIEFEYESKNFMLHGHDPKGCDVIVCWRHNWKECPGEIEVVELSRLFGMA